MEKEDPRGSRGSPGKWAVNGNSSSVSLSGGGIELDLTGSQTCQLTSEVWHILGMIQHPVVDVQHFTRTSQ